MHGLPVVPTPVFFPSSSKNEECWWGTLDPRTIYVWDSMDDQDKQTSLPPTPIPQPRREGKQEINRPLTQAESKLALEDLNKETITQTRFWRLRPDDIAFCPTTESKEVIFCILEFKRMSDITDQYLIRTRPRPENQYVSLRRDLGETIQSQDWRVEQISFITGSRSLHEEDLRKNLKFCQVPEASIEVIGSKLAC